MYTPDYELPAMWLKRSCEKLGIKIDAVRVEPNGRTWRQIIQYKPRFIYQMLIKHRMHERTVVWIDADSIVQKYPVLFDEIDADFATRLWDSKDTVIEKQVIEEKPANANKFEPMCGVIYMKNTRAVRAMVDLWARASEEYKPTVRRPDQKSLKKTLVVADAIKYEALPSSYCFLRRFWPHKSHPLYKEAYIVVSRWWCKDVVEAETYAYEEGRRMANGTWDREDWRW